MESSTGTGQPHVDVPGAPASRIPAHAGAALQASGLRSLSLRGATLLPIVQGGMGVGVSAHRLAGSVAAEGGIGTISAIDLRRLHPDLMERTRGRGVGP
jgi:nitronate monooxygenase